MGNISTVVERALRKHSAESIPELSYTLSSNLEFRLIFPVDLTKPFKEAKRDFLKGYLSDLLAMNLGNISVAAKKANLNRRHLHRIISELEINSGSYRREMIKPAEYMKENVQEILEETLSNFPSIDKSKQIYSRIDDISSIIAENIGTSLTFDEAMDMFEREFITRVLKLNNYDIAKAAEALDMSERTVYRKISKLNIVL